MADEYFFEKVFGVSEIKPFIYFPHACNPNLFKHDWLTKYRLQAVCKHNPGSVLHQKPTPCPQVLHIRTDYVCYDESLSNLIN